MGILNVTPDSFYSVSRCPDEASIIKRIETIEEGGADIIDIGGYSSRPMAEDISPDEEYARLSKGLSLIKRYAPDTIISIDTFRADVARRCIENYGASIINDISGGTLDDNMFATVGRLGMPYILMHMRGNPTTMTKLTDYTDVTADVISDLSHKVSLLVENGVNDIIIDPGFGFSKNVEQNYELMAHLEEFKVFNMPLLVGISRKSMIYKLLETTPEQSLNGTSVLNTIALMAGASILRVHDVAQAVETVKIVETTLNQ
ncbi:MAG: dihydropteroate synthase [Muribaculaceae bacterium]|nr:dihydropteroate synthase [Muribaculaceae bacterium]